MQPGTPPGWYAPPGTPGPEANAPWGAGAAPGDATLLPGGFGIRALAHIVDVVATMIVAAVSGVVGAVSVGVLAAARIVGPDWEHKIAKNTPGTLALGFLAALLYHTFSEGLGGATVGKALCGLRVLTEEREPCTLGKALGRNLAYYIDGLFFGLVAWSSMSKSPMKQRYGDRWAKTIVVHASSMPAATRQSPALGILAGLAAYSLTQVAAVLLKVL